MGTTLKQNTYYPYSSGTLMPLDDGWGPSPTQKYVSAEEKDVQVFHIILKYGLLILGRE